MEKEIIEEIMKERGVKKRLVEEMIKISLNNGYDIEETKVNILKFLKTKNK